MSAAGTEIDNEIRYKKQGNAQTPSKPTAELAPLGAPRKDGNTGDLVGTDEGRKIIFDDDKGQDQPGGKRRRLRSRSTRRNRRKSKRRIRKSKKNTRKYRK